MKQLRAAVEAKDTDALAALLADDAMYFSTHV
jgi:ketosteroid isomerase-like protein